MNYQPWMSDDEQVQEDARVEKVITERWPEDLPGYRLYKRRIRRRERHEARQDLRSAS